MYRTLPYWIIGILLLVMIVFYMENYQPELTADILIKLDIFSLTSVAQEERERLYRIKELSIPYEEKQVLINRTVFMDATTEMVTLALGPPQHSVEKLHNIDGQNVLLVYYIYYMAADKRPTIMVFREDKLVNAYKGSALDIK